jgi:hypothetical protein
MNKRMMKQGLVSETLRTINLVTNQSRSGSLYFSSTNLIVSMTVNPEGKKDIIISESIF